MRSFSLEVTEIYLIIVINYHEYSLLFSDEFKEAAARRQKLEDRIMDRNQRGGHIGIGADKALSKAQIEDLWEVSILEICLFPPLLFFAFIPICL